MSAPGLIGLGAVIAINDGAGGAFVPLNDCVEVTPPKESTKFLDSSNLGSTNIQTFLESMTDPGKLMVKQEYSASDLARMRAFKANIGPTGGNPGGGGVKITMPDGLAMILPVGIEDCEADQFKNEPIVTMTTNFKVLGPYTSITLPLPVVTSVTPSTGVHTGGTSVQITGKNLLMATVVNFGASNPANFVVNSDTSITVASAPAGTAGATNVTVTTGGTGITGGTSATGAGNAWTYT